MGRLPLQLLSQAGWCAVQVSQYDPCREYRVGNEHLLVPVRVFTCCCSFVLVFRLVYLTSIMARAL